ncbi:MAG: DUF6460 domain-containing protein [Beijerinckiaceae bacterium]
MSDQNATPRPPGWENASWPGKQPAPASGAQPVSGFERFIGGSPGMVAVRLLVVSLVVGAILMWLDIRPQDVFFAIERFFQRIWRMGFSAIREIINYVIVGALIVVPVWFVLRLVNMRR